jgi:hypothetical protein
MLGEITDKIDNDIINIRRNSFMEIKKKNILFNILISCIIITTLIFIEIYYIKNNLTIKNIIIKVIAAIIAGILIEIYITFLKNINHKNNNFFSFRKRNYLQWLLVWLANGVLFFGIGMGTFLLFIALFILQISIRNLTQIINIYLLALTGGITFSAVCFIIHIIYDKIKNKKKII